MSRRVEYSEARPLRAVFVGLGSSGCRHLQNLARRAPVEVTAWRAKGAALPSGIAQLVRRQTGSLHEALAADADVAFITNPTSLHMEAALSAAACGTHLFIEKPLSDRLDGLEELAAQVAARDLLTLVGYNARHRPTLQTVKRWLDEERIGRPLSVRAQIGEWLPDWHPDEDYRDGVSARRDLGGGVLLDLSHEFDNLLWLLGPVRRVSCFAGQISSLQIETEDVAEILLEFETGAIGNVHMDCVQRPASRTCHIHGERGSIVWDALQPVARLFEAEAGSWTEHREPAGERARSFKIEMDHWLECLRSGDVSAVPLQEGSAALRLALAAKRSAAEGQAVEIGAGA